MQIYDQALLIDPNNAEIYARKGNVYWEVGRFEDALQAHERSIALDPTVPGYYGDKATVLSQLGRREEAKKADAQYYALMEQLGQVEWEWDDTLIESLTPQQQATREQEMKELWSYCKNIRETNKNEETRDHSGD